MKSLIVSLMLLAYPQLSFAAVDAWRMNQFTGKPDYYQTGVDSTTLTALAVSTSALAVQTAALSVSTAANAARITSLESSTSTLKTRVDALEVSTATLDSTLSAEILVRQALSTQVAIDTTTISNAMVSKSDYNEFTSSNSFASIIVASGTHGSGDDLLAAGVGSRFFFYPKKSSIRGGAVSADQWNDANIGNWSVALGYNPTASAQYTTAIGNTNTATYSGAVAVGGGSNNATGENSAVFGGSSNNVSGQNSGALAGNQVNVTGNQAGALSGGPSTVSSDFGVSLGGTNTTVSGIASGAGGQWTQVASDYSFVWGNYVGLSSAADGSMLFGYDTSSVKTYTEPNKFYIHGLDLRVSSSTTAAVQYGLTKEGAATVDSIAVKGTNSDKSAYVLTNDGSGNASWQPGPSASGLTYVATSLVSDISGYNQMKNAIDYTPSARSTTTVTNPIVDQYISSFATNVGYPGITEIPAGVYKAHIHASASNANRFKFKFEVYIRHADGTDVEFLESTDSTPYLTTSELEYDLYGIGTSTQILTTDRLVTKLKITASEAPGTGTISVYSDGIGSGTGGQTNSHFEMPSVAASVANFVPYNAGVKDVNLNGHSLTAAGISVSSITASGDVSMTGTTTISSATITGYISIGLDFAETTCAASAGVDTCTSTACDTGKKVISGGCRFDAPGVFAESRPASDLTVWYCRSSVANAEIRASRVCARIK